jgi:amidase
MPVASAAASPPLEEPLRVSVVRDPDGNVDPHVAAGVDRAAEALADAGYAVSDIQPPALAEAAELWTRLVFTEIGALMLPKLRALLDADSLRFLELVLEHQPPLGLEAYAEALGERRGIARRWTLFQKRYPLVLAPVSTEPAFVVGKDVSSLAGAVDVLQGMRFVTPFNLLGLPSLALPVGIADGLPQGVQLIANRYREDVCLDAGEAIEARLGTLAPIDPRPSRAG